MQVRVRLSGELARATGAPRIALDLADGATVGELRQAVEARHPELGGALTSALPVIAGSHASLDHVLRHGDEVALLLPAAGGSIPS